jgi:hypothetical protein
LHLDAAAGEPAPRARMGVRRRNDRSIDRLIDHEEGWDQPTRPVVLEGQLAPNLAVLALAFASGLVSVWRTNVVSLTESNDPWLALDRFAVRRPHAPRAHEVLLRPRPAVRTRHAAAQQNGNKSNSNSNSSSVVGCAAASRARGGVPSTLSSSHSPYAYPTTSPTSGPWPAYPSRPTCFASTAPRTRRTWFST